MLWLFATQSLARDIEAAFAFKLIEADCLTTGDEPLAMISAAADFVSNERATLRFLDIVAQAVGFHLVDLA